MNTDNLAFWIALNHAPGLNAHALNALLQRFGTVENICSADRKELKQVVGENPETIQGILRGPDPQLLDNILQWLVQPGHRLLTLEDIDYPPLLREIPDPPIVLYVSGDSKLLRARQVAIVGSRNPTPAGRENALMFAKALSGAGLAITSGLATGIDAAAHQGALAGAGRTIAVAGTGVDRVYPAHHRELAHRIVAQGAIISEFPLGSAPRREHFPRRNRIISGLSLGTLVVEAASQSGSLITARLAAEQGREVFAIPGSIHSPLARGCHALIRQGAKLVETAQDVLEELGALVQWAGKLDTNAENDSVSLEPGMSELLQHLGYDPTSLDTLVERSGLTPEVISSMLLEMELCGLVQPSPGGKYLRTHSLKGRF